jgi:hypothetical protein
VFVGSGSLEDGWRLRLRTTAASSAARTKPCSRAAPPAA